VFFLGALACEKAGDENGTPGIQICAGGALEGHPHTQLARRRLRKLRTDIL